MSCLVSHWESESFFSNWDVVIVGAGFACFGSVAELVSDLQTQLLGDVCALVERRYVSAHKKFRSFATVVRTSIAPSAWAVWASRSERWWAKKPLRWWVRRELGEVMPLLLGVCF